MKRTILIYSLILLCTFVQAKAPLFKYGLEWGYSANVVEGHKFVYQTETEPHYLAPVDEGVSWSYASNAFVLANVGLNVSDRSSICLLGGYAGLNRDRRAFPLMFRYSFFSRGVQSDGHFFYAGGGCAFLESEPTVGAIAELGAGHRYAIASYLNLDFTLSVRGSYDQPRVWDPIDQTYISPQYVRKNDAFYLSINFGVALNF